MAFSEPLIRKIEEGDFERVAELTNSSFPHMMMTPSKVCWRRSLGYNYFVAVVNSEVVGFVDIRLRQKTAKLMGMAVDEKFRSHGVGSALIRKTIEFATEKGRKTLYLNVRCDNLTAMNFYKRQGFLLKKERERDGERFYILHRKLET
jgi:ribosomal protein S18 acetylase RimI-like enzyme